jgi:hypothetical protein
MCLLLLVTEVEDVVQSLVAVKILRVSMFQLEDQQRYSNLYQVRTEILYYATLNDAET